LDAERKARLGARWACSECGVAFYDLGKPDALCPKCGAKQLRARQAPAKPKRAPKKAKGNYRGGLQRNRSEPEARPEEVVIVEPDDDESAVAEEDLEE
jgi:hypothetical protein